MQEKTGLESKRLRSSQVRSCQLGFFQLRSLQTVTLPGEVLLGDVPARSGPAMGSSVLQDGSLWIPPASRMFMTLLWAVRAAQGLAGVEMGAAEEDQPSLAREAERPGRVAGLPLSTLPNKELLSQFPPQSSGITVSPCRWEGGVSNTKPEPGPGAGAPAGSPPGSGPAVAVTEHFGGQERAGRALPGCRPQSRLFLPHWAPGRACSAFVRAVPFSPVPFPVLVGVLGHPRGPHSLSSRRTESQGSAQSSAPGSRAS